MKTIVKKHFRKGRIVSKHFRTIKQEKGYAKHFYDTNLNDEELRLRNKRKRHPSDSAWAVRVESDDDMVSKDCMVKKNNITFDDRERWLNDAQKLSKESEEASFRGHFLWTASQLALKKNNPDSAFKLAGDAGRAMEEAAIKEEAAKEAISLAEEL